MGIVKRIASLLNKAQQLERCTVVRTETGLLGVEEGVNERREALQNNLLHDLTDLAEESNWPVV